MFFIKAEYYCKIQNKKVSIGMSKRPYPDKEKLEKFRFNFNYIIPIVFGLLAVNYSHWYYPLAFLICTISNIGLDFYLYRKIKSNKRIIINFLLLVFFAYLTWKFPENDLGRKNYMSSLVF